MTKLDMNHPIALNSHVFPFSTALIDPIQGITGMVVKYTKVIGIARLEDGMQIVELQIKNEFNQDGTLTVISLPATAVILVTW